MKVVIKIEKEVKNCFECPYREKVYEQGYSAYECTKLGCYSTIPKEGIRKDCPFIKNS